jgi:hypothetical protein
MLLRIAYLCHDHDMLPERVFMANEIVTHLSSDSRFTFTPEGSKDVRVIGKEDKLGVIVVVTSTVAVGMLPVQVITKGVTQNTLRKFLDGSSFAELGSGDKAMATATARGTVGEHGLLAEHPPYYQNATTGHMIVSGNKTHWTNKSSQRLCVDAIVWPSHKQDCKE